MGVIYKYLNIHSESRSLNKNNNAWARSLVRQSDGLLIHRPGVQIPSGPLYHIFFSNFHKSLFHRSFWKLSRHFYPNPFWLFYSV